jgi:tetratricopeptide (TPR) repeat protein
MDNEEIFEEIQRLIEDGHRYHERGQHALSLECYQKAIQRAVPLGDRGLMAYLLRHAASEHRDCDNYQHAADLVLAALAMVEGVDELIELRASIKKLLAITFSDIFGPRKPEVLKLLQESREEYAQVGDVGQEANVLQHIGGNYVALGQLAEGDGFLMDALNKACEADDVQLQGWILNTMAGLEIERGEWGLALEYARNAREKVLTVEDTEAEGDTWVTEARILRRMGHADEALQAAQRALDLYTNNENRRRSIRARRHIAKVLVAQEDLDEAVTMLEEAMHTATRLDLRRDQAIVHLQWADIERARQNYGLAHEHAIRARALAEDEGLDDLADAADDLLRQCREEEREI